MIEINAFERIFVMLSVRDSSRHNLIMSCWRGYLNKFNQTLKSEGKVKALLTYKEMYTFMVHKSLGLAQPTFVGWYKIDRKGIPKPLWPLRAILGKELEPNEVRVLLTITRVYQTIRLPENPDLCKITDPGVKLPDQFITDFTKYVKRWVANVVLEDDKDLYSEKVIRTTKRGPNGPAVATSPLDAQALAHDPKLREAIVGFNLLTENEHYNEFLEANTFSSDPGRFHSRLGFAKEGGGKTRIFAICDYWSQLTVKPLHKSLMGILRRLTTDATYDQDKGFARVLRESVGKETFCFDLSGASDRIPVSLQTIIIGEIFGPELSQLWQRILTDRTFHSKYGDVRWEVGQPLGLLSSWPAFALWHHIIIEFLAFQEGITSFREYEILGDDVVIWNRTVGLRYETFIPSIGIPINSTKSLRGTATGSQVEFAKRIGLNGRELSGISYHIFENQSLGQIPQLITLMGSRSLINHGADYFSLSPVYPRNRNKQDKASFIISYCLHLIGSPLKEVTAQSGHYTDFNEIGELVNEIRKDKLKEALGLVYEDMSEQTDMVPLLERLRVPYSPTALRDLEGPNPDWWAIHPLYLVQTQLGENLMKTLLSINMYDPSDEDIKEIEYVPKIPGREYFYCAKALKSNHLTTVILDARQRLIDEGVNSSD